MAHRCVPDKIDICGHGISVNCKVLWLICLSVGISVMVVFHDRVPLLGTFCLHYVPSSSKRQGNV